MGLRCGRNLMAIIQSDAVKLHDVHYLIFKFTKNNEKWK